MLKNTLVEKVAWKPIFFEFCNCCKWQVPLVRGKKFHHKLKDSLTDQLEQNNVVARDLPSVAVCS